ncbi:MAG TPA: DNA glycosylase [Candidatus Acidoferrum sp.]|nr:DNA glycosylase [Candidatus Acidoferrum sp.]
MAGRSLRPIPCARSSSIRAVFKVRDYDLAGTFTSGQAFRWQPHSDNWVGVIGQRWVRLEAHPSGITAETAEPAGDWAWLTHYLQLDVDLTSVLKTFPADEPLRAAIRACRGLRLLRQDPWECLASFILSSTKQICQIQEIISLLCERYGSPLPAPPAQKPMHAFPAAARLARLSEADLRACKMGFRAPFLLQTARLISSGAFDLGRLSTLPLDSARAGLMDLPGVGRKIADCVLLFAYGRLEAFPVDVWVAKALRELYFPRRRISLKGLHEFAAGHFGPYAGYAQQYLFHYMRVSGRNILLSG